MERTFAIVKPDAVASNHIGQIIFRFEDIGLKVVGLQMITMSLEQAERLYEEHRERPYFSVYVSFMTSGPIVVLVLEGVAAVARARAILGNYNPEKAMSGTLRHDFGKPDSRGILNVAHASENARRAATEASIFFPSLKSGHIYPQGAGA